MNKQKVLVFKDIKNNRWTIYNANKTKHLGYSNELFLKHCNFVVCEDKRKKVIKTKKRFPHAWIIGTLSKKTKKPIKNVTYNPFTDLTFKNKSKKVLSSKVAYLDSFGKVWI